MGLPPDLPPGPEIIRLDMSLDFAPAERHPVPQLVVGQNSPAHPVAHRFETPIEPAGDFRFADEIFRRQSAVPEFLVFRFHFLVLPPVNGGAVKLRDPGNKKTPVNTGVGCRNDRSFFGHFQSSLASPWRWMFRAPLAFKSSSICCRCPDMARKSSALVCVTSSINRSRLITVPLAQRHFRAT